MAPWGCCWLLRVCRLIMRAPSTITLPFFGETLMIRPRLPLSAPAMTTTSSPFLTCIPAIILLISKIGDLNDLRRQGDNFHEFLFAQFTGDWSEDAGPARIQFFIDDNNRIAIKSQVRPIVSADGFACAHNNGINNF